MKGSIVIGELTIPITEMDLAPGRVVLRGSLPSPCPEIIADHYEVYDRNGALVYHCDRHFDFPAHVGTWTVTFELHIAAQTATPGQPGVLR
jgi:hypothetical protein